MAEKKPVNAKKASSKPKGAPPRKVRKTNGKVKKLDRRREPAS
jgi:hypothetical protein